MVMRRLVWEIGYDDVGSDTKAGREDNMALSLVMAPEWGEVPCTEMEIYKRKRRFMRSVMLNFIVS